MNKALIFDCDGVLADTEQHGHLPAFNRMWDELGVPWRWSVEQYGEKLKIGGGKERMASLIHDPEFTKVFAIPTSEQQRAELLSQWHRRKSEIYAEIIASGLIPPRSGVRRLAAEASANGWKLGVASTSAQSSVEAVLKRAVGAESASRFVVLAGDVVQAKKPAPDIYRMASVRLEVDPAHCIAVEDSGNGLTAAVRAGMKCIVTRSGYTHDDDFSQAELVLTCLGDPDGEVCRVLANRSAASPGSYFKAEDLEALLGSKRA